MSYNFKDFDTHHVTITNNTLEFWQALISKLVSKGSWIAVNSRIGQPNHLELNFNNPMWNKVISYYKSVDVEVIDNPLLKLNEAFIYRDYKEDLIQYEPLFEKHLKFDPNNFTRRIMFSGGIIDKLHNRRERIGKLLG
jgi:hypothetical protein